MVILKDLRMWLLFLNCRWRMLPMGLSLSLRARDIAFTVSGSCAMLCVLMLAHGDSEYYHKSMVSMSCPNCWARTWKLNHLMLEHLWWWCLSTTASASGAGCCSYAHACVNAIEHIEFHNFKTDIIVGYMLTEHKYRSHNKRLGKRTLQMTQCELAPV
jgi:hypothetical protein